MPGTAALTLASLHATAALIGFGFGPAVPLRSVPPSGDAPAPPAPGGEAPASPAPPPPAARGFLPIRYVETSEPAVAITFDACATRTHVAGFDRNVFDVVKREGVPVTIFVSGRWVEAHADVMTELAGDPLVEFGDHSYDHPHMSHLPVARIVEEIDQTEAALARYGKRSVAFRPPFGEWSHRLVYVVQDLRLPTVTWDVVSGDPSARTTTDGMIRNVLGKARPGSIIIFHINGRGWKTAEALPAILRGLRERGFRFVPLSALMGSARTTTTAEPGPAPAPPPAVVAPIPIGPGPGAQPPIAPLPAVTEPPPLPPAGHAPL
jgi:peptidoglycan/xylan/chitin deacetylase (PgdA/CDA1 family)